MYMRLVVGLMTILLTGITVTSSQKCSANSLPGTHQTIKVTLTLGGGSFGPIRQGYSAMDNITIVVWMTNTAEVPVKVCASSTLRQDRPLLLRNGQQLEYRTEISEFLQKNSADPCEVVRVPEMIELPPNKPTMVGWLILSEGGQQTGNVKWYEPLEPGKYQLSLLRSFDCCNGQRVKSQTISFEVGP
jgi:hypothetical protein